MIPKYVTIVPLVLSALSSTQQVAAFHSSKVFGVVAPSSGFQPSSLQKSRIHAEPPDSTGSSSSTAPPAPVLNGKRVLPYKVLMAGLQGNSNLAGVFAILNNGYKRGYAGWENCEHIGVSLDLQADLMQLAETLGPDKVAHVRALSFLFPSEGAMQSIADDWRKEAAQAGGKIHFDPVLAAMEMPFDETFDIDDDDDLDEDDLEFMEMTAQAIGMATATAVTTTTKTANDENVVSPFEMPPPAAVTTTKEEKIPFTKENVDKVLEEVRPYLISDGGNVSVERVDEETRNVYLKLEGACGSCPSSTVTMQMGIERVLKENFENLGQVLQVDDKEAAPKELSFEMVAVEVNRITPAIIAMGGSVEIVSVDGTTGIVELRFKGASKVRQGLELAVRDVDFVKEVHFVE